MRRRFDELAAWLGRALAFPVGVVQLTGTGIVPDEDFTLRPGEVVRIEVETTRRPREPRDRGRPDVAEREE